MRIRFLILALLAWMLLSAATGSFIDREPNDTLAQAVEIFPEHPYQGYLSEKDNDVFRLVSPHPRGGYLLRLQLEAPALVEVTGTDLDVRLQLPAGEHEVPVPIRSMEDEVFLTLTATGSAGGYGFSLNLEEIWPDAAEPNDEARYALVVSMPPQEEYEKRIQETGLYTPPWYRVFTQAGTSGSEDADWFAVPVLVPEGVMFRNFTCAAFHPSLTAATVAIDLEQARALVSSRPQVELNRFNRSVRASVLINNYAAGIVTSDVQQDGVFLSVLRVSNHPTLYFNSVFFTFPVALRQEPTAQTFPGLERPAISGRVYGLACWPMTIIDNQMLVEGIRTLFQPQTPVNPGTDGSLPPTGDVGGTESRRFLLLEDEDTRLWSSQTLVNYQFCLYYDANRDGQYAPGEDIRAVVVVRGPDGAELTRFRRSCFTIPLPYERITVHVPQLLLDVSLTAREPSWFKGIVPPRLPSFLP